MTRIIIDNNSNLNNSDASQLCADLFISFMTNNDGLIESPCGHNVYYSRERCRGYLDHMFLIEDKKPVKRDINLKQ